MTAELPFGLDDKEADPTTRTAQSWLLLAVGEDRQHGGNDGYEN
jgi:hypothetical protein